MSALPGEVTRPSYKWRPGNLVSYGAPFEKLTKSHLERLGKSRVLLIVSTSLQKNTNEVHRLEQELGNMIVYKRVGMTPHTYWTEILEIVEQGRKHNIDSIVTLGGGSLIDGAKVTTMVIHDDRVRTDDPDALKPFITGGAKGYANSPNARPSGVPIVVIPTTLSAGEYSGYAGCVDPRDMTKYTFIHPENCPKVLILDGRLCATTPLEIWMSTGVRAIDHCAELLSRVTDPDPDVDEASKEGIVLLVRGMLKLIDNPTDEQERLNTLIGAGMAMDGCCKKILFGGSHAIGHALGSLGVPHGVTSCIMLPATMKYNKRVNAERQQLCFDALWSDPVIAKTLESRACFKEVSDLADVLDTLFRAFGVPRGLKEIDFAKPEDLDRTADRTLIDIFCKGNPIPLDKTEVLKILNKAL